MEKTYNQELQKQLESYIDASHISQAKLVSPSRKNVQKSR